MKFKWRVRLLLARDRITSLELPVLYVMLRIEPAIRPDLIETAFFGWVR